jgi:hypothetical protein
MQAKQVDIKANFTTAQSKAKNYNNDKEVIGKFVIIDKTTERTIVDCRLYMGRSRSSSTVYASIWVNIKDSKKPKDWVYGFTSGTGYAGGYGYHKQSAAVQDALTSAGIGLYNANKARRYIDGVGDSAIREALLAVAYTAGYNSVIFVSC